MRHKTDKLALPDGSALLLVAWGPPCSIAEKGLKPIRSTRW